MSFQKNGFGLLSNHVFLEKKAYSKMMYFASDNPNHEVIGVLFGDMDDKGNLYVKNVHTMRVGERTDVEFLDEDYVNVYQLIKKYEKENKKWVGWFHSHPFKNGDHIYMSKKDVRYHESAQNQNPLWTAIVINPHQKDDPSTTKGMRAFRLKIKNKKFLNIFSSKSKVKRLKLFIEDKKS